MPPLRYGEHQLLRTLHLIRKPNVVFCGLAMQPTMKLTRRNIVSEMWSSAFWATVQDTRWYQRSHHNE